MQGENIQKRNETTAKKENIQQQKNMEICRN